MSDPGATDRAVTSSHRPGENWPQLYEHAATALMSALAERRELAPDRVAGVVARHLPAPLGAWLLGRLSALGWLSAATPVPFDVLESPACPPDMRGARKELVRLALFGAGGQGRPYDARHRQAAFAHLSAEVQREALDANTLAAAANRALSHPDACADPVLAGMLRAFVADQEVLLESTIGRKKAEPAPISYLRHAFEKNKRAITPLPTRAELRDRFQRLAAALEKQYAQYDEEAARSGLERMRELQRSYPVHIGPERLAAAEKMYANLVKRRAGFLKLIDALVEKACGAARAEDHKTAAWLTRRIWAIHALFPILLPEEAARVHRDRIARISEEHEQRESARDLRLREHAVAVEIKKLAAIIHHFHEVTEGMKPDDPEYSAAEQSYRAAVQAVRSHDNEWLTGLMLELETLLEEVHDASGRAEAHVERFLTSVRSALVHMRQEIHAIHAERPDRSRHGK